MNTWLAGPVVVTGSSGHVGRAVACRLAQVSNQVRTPSTADDWVAAMDGADAVVHLAGTLAPVKPNTLELANVGTARRTASAVAGSRVQRVSMLSYATADASSGNAYLRAKAQAERLLTDTGRGVVVLRSTLVVGPPQDPGPSFAPFVAHEGKPVTLLGRGTQQIAPVFVDDVAEAVVRAALDPDAVTGTYGLGGPDVLTLDAMVDLLNGGSVEKRHLPPRIARLLAHVMPRLNPALVEVLIADSLPPHPLAAEAFDLPLHHLTAVYPDRT